jgi:hypothetical protein
MASRERLIEKIKVLPEDSLKEAAKFLDALEERDIPLLSLPRRYSLFFDV